MLKSFRKKITWWGVFLFLSAVVLCVGAVSVVGMLTTTISGTTSEKDVVIHTTENQILKVTPDEGREAYVVGTGEIVGSFRFIPVTFVDAPGRQELLTVPKSVELLLNEPVKVRFLRVNDGLIGGLNYVLELVEPSVE